MHQNGHPIFLAKPRNRHGGRGHSLAATDRLVLLDQNWYSGRYVGLSSPLAMHLELLPVIRRKRDQHGLSRSSCEVNGIAVHLDPTSMVHESQSYVITKSVDSNSHGRP